MFQTLLKYLAILCLLFVVCDRMKDYNQLFDTCDKLELVDIETGEDEPGEDTESEESQFLTDYSTDKNTTWHLKPESSYENSLYKSSFQILEKEPPEC